MGVTVREWKGAWWIFVNHQGRRKAKRVGTGEEGKKAAKQVAQQLEARLALGQPAFQEDNAGVKFAEYAETWLDRIKHIRKHTTAGDYRKMLDRDILPALRGFDLKDITREKVKAVAFAGLKKGQSPKTVQNVIRCLSSLLSHAVEDGLLIVNTALRPGKFLPKISKRRGINPLTREEVAVFLKVVKDKAPRYYPLFLCAVRTGLRMGELLALQWGDFDFRERFIQVSRSYTHWKLTTPKSGESRRVDMSLGLTQALKDLLLERQVDAGAHGTEIPPWVFCNQHGGLLHPHNLRDRVFYGLLEKAKLRQVRFHDLRHTFASLLLQQGESPVYVKEQLGHSSIQITVDCYGYLIPGGNKQAVDRLDTPVAEAQSATPAQPPQVYPGPAPADLPNYPVVRRRGFGVSDGFRTRNLLGHSQAL